MSRLRRLIDDVYTAERDEERRVEPDGRVLVPWQVYSAEGLTLTVHYFTNALNELVGVRAEENRDAVSITVVERRTSNKLPGQRRAQTLTLADPLAARRVIDAATGRPRERFVPDPAAGWRAFDVAAAEWLLGGDGMISLQEAAAAALEEGCEGVELERVAAGNGDLSQVFIERGLDVPTSRAAAKIAVDAALGDAVEEDAYAESIGWTLDAAARSGRMEPDQREQLGDMLQLYEQMQHALESKGHARDEAERLLAAAQSLHQRGGLLA